MCPKTFKRSARSQNNYQFYLPNFPKFCGNISHKLLRPSEFLEKIQAPLPYLMLQNLGRVATPTKLVPWNCLIYLQNTFAMRGGGLVSEFI